MGTPLPSATVAARREARWIPPFLVLAVMVAIVLGGHVIAAGLGGDGLAPAADTIQLGDLVIRPPDGWDIAERFDELTPGSGVPGIRLLNEGATVLVLAYPGAGTATAALDRYSTEVIDPQAIEVRASEVRTVEGALGQGVRQSYVGTFEGLGAPVEGDITAFASPGGTGLVVDGWAGEGQFGQFTGEVHGIGETAEAV